MKTPITNPLSYARARELLAQAKRLEAMSNRLRQQAQMATVELQSEVCALREEIADLKSIITDREFDIASLQREKEAIPRDGKHSELVKRLISEVINQGGEEHINNSNGSDYYECPQCLATSRITYVKGYPTSEPIKHHDNCAFKLAEVIEAAIAAEDGN